MEKSKIPGISFLALPIAKTCPRNLIKHGAATLFLYSSLALQQRTEEKPAAELLSEHCFAGKCSTSHVLDPGDAWERSWLAGAAS